MEMHRFTMGPFDSRETSEPSYRQVQRREIAQRRADQNGMRSVYRQTALCALIVALLIVLELFVFREMPEAVPASAPTAAPAAAASATDTTGEDGEDSLGKLQFVNGRVYSVFSSDVHWTLPLSPLEAETLENGKILRLTADSGTTVCSVAVGQVTSIDMDDEYGTTVRVHHGDGRESIYSGLDGVCVEVGQPLLAGDTIGAVDENGALYIAVSEHGETVPVLERFDADFKVT